MVETEAHMDIDSTTNQSRILVAPEAGSLSRQRPPEVCADVIVAFAFFTTIPPVELKKAHEGALPEDPEQDTENFGPLKSVLKAVATVHANRKVRTHFPP